jgi:uncharacterized protein
LIIDTHTHVWPDAIAGRALAGILPEIPRHGDGTLLDLTTAMARAGIDKSVCLAVATVPNHVDAANRFAASLDDGQFIGFGAIHPDIPTDDLVANLRSNGLKGVKIHPLFQHIDLDDIRLFPILDAMQGEFVVTVHVGAGGESTAVNRLCTPDKLLRMIKRFPRLQVIACHFGAYRLLHEAREMIVGQPVFLDTAWPPSLSLADPSLVREIINQHGPDRVVFGSDWPMADPAAELSAIERLGLAAGDVDAILGGNMQRLLG